MKGIGILLLIAVVMTFVNCRNGYSEKNNVLISKKFLDDKSYSIVCLGYPKADLEGVARTESSKRAALLNAYYFAGQIFDQSVSPDMDGSVEKYDVESNSATIYFVIHKNKLRDRLKK